MQGCFWTVLALIVLAIGGAWYLVSHLTWTKGRPLRGRRVPRAKPDANVGSTAEEAAARHWQRMAQEEYESIAAFGELALDLLAAGAPMQLVTRCHEAALEEAAHTRICLDMASRLSGRVSHVTSISSLRRARRRPRWRRALLVRLAVESHIDGWVGEASSARVLAELARDASDARMRDALRTLAREEMRHARLGRQIVLWCTTEGGPLVSHALRIAEKRFATLQVSLPERENPQDLRHLGVPNAKLRAAAIEASRLKATPALGISNIESQ